METAKIKATISEQELRTEVMGTGGDIIMCVAAVMNTLAEGIARDEKRDIGEATAQVAALAFKRMIQLQAVGTSAHIDVETLRRVLEGRQ